MEQKNFYVWDGVFAIVKAKEIINDAFAIIQDKNEITVIIDESKRNRILQKIVQ